MSEFSICAGAVPDFMCSNSSFSTTTEHGKPEWIRVYEDQLLNIAAQEKQSKTDISSKRKNNLKRTTWYTEFRAMHCNIPTELTVADGQKEIQPSIARVQQKTSNKTEEDALKQPRILSLSKWMQSLEASSEVISKSMMYKIL